MIPVLSGGNGVPRDCLLPLNLITGLCNVNPPLLNLLSHSVGGLLC